MGAFGAIYACDVNMDFVSQVARAFADRPKEWIRAIDLEAVGGRQAWRTRVSDCRIRFGMVIENRVRTIRRPDGSRYRVSEYRFCPEDREI